MNREELYNLDFGEKLKLIRAKKAFKCVCR